MDHRTGKRTSLLIMAFGVLAALPASAAPIGTLNFDSCIGGGVTVTALSIDFATGCVQTGAGTSLVTSLGNINPGLSGPITNVANPLPPGFVFFSFNPGGGFVTFEPTSLGPGVANTNCGAPPCSIVAGSPFVLVGGVSTTVFLPVAGIVTDSSGSSNFVGQLSANFAGMTPSQLQAAFLANGELTATTFAGSFVSQETPVIPEPSTLALAGLGAAFLGISRAMRQWKEKA